MIKILIVFALLALIAGVTYLVIRDTTKGPESEPPPNEDDKQWPQYGGDR